jgi:hypothetical protein
MKKGKMGKILGIGLVLVLVVGVLGGIANIAGASSEKTSRSAQCIWDFLFSWGLRDTTSS